MLVFGSFLAHPDTALGLPKSASPLQILQALSSLIVRDAVMDYECAGSNVWVYLCLQFVPSALILAKILIN
jgi:hypothetical protein